MDKQMKICRMFVIICWHTELGFEGLMTSKVTQLNQPPTANPYVRVLNLILFFSALKQKHFKSELKQVLLVIDEI